MDLDFFKQFNDTHGHQGGDEVLRSIGRTLTQSVKSGDLPCRYGGEEFAVVMPNTDAAGAAMVADRLRRAIEATNIRFSNQTLRVTASVGIAEYGAGEESLQLVRRADDAVYASKKAGRNCGHWHNGAASVPIETKGRSTIPAIVAGIPAKPQADGDAPGAKSIGSVAEFDVFAPLWGGVSRRAGEQGRRFPSLTFV